ncbi:MAG TPA: hypothetical protein VI757_03840, partial [Bacteroidia bacterium]|nr:hypothetical protein [Bacteroidia bacterium]
MKKCSKCSQVKPVHGFRKRSDNKHLYQSHCIECHKNTNSIYYQNNRKKIIKKNNEWRSRNSDKKKSAARKLYQKKRHLILEQLRVSYANLSLNEKEIALEKGRRYRRENSKAYLEQKKQYSINNRKAMSAYSLKYRKQRAAKDPLFKLRIRLSSRTCAIFLRKGWLKDESS